MSPELLSLLLKVVPFLLGIAFLWLFVTRFVKNIPQGKIGIVERKYWGKKIRTGRVYATDGEIGIEADYLKPGLHLLFWPVRQLVTTVPFVSIGGDELGYIEATDGEPLPG